MRFVNRYTVGLSFLAMLAVNGIAATTSLLNGVKTDQVSMMNETLLTPAGFTFSIWSVIYSLLLIYVVMQFGIAKKWYEDRKMMLEKVAPYFVLSCSLNIGWIFTWHSYNFIYSLEVALALMVLLLLTLIKIYNLVSDYSYNLPDGMLIRAPFSIYIGWISVATILSVSMVLLKHNVDIYYSFSVLGANISMAQSMWSQVVIVVAGMLGVVALVMKRDIFFAMTMIWALYGISYRHANDIYVPWINFIPTREIAETAFYTLIGLTVLTVVVALEQLYLRVKRLRLENEEEKASKEA